MMGFKHLGIKQSDFAEFSPVNAKRHFERCLFKNGALSKAIMCARYTIAPQAAGSAVYLAPNISGATIPDRKL